MQLDSLTFPTLGSPPRSNTASTTPFVSAPSSPGSNRMNKAFFFSAPTSPTCPKIVPYGWPQEQEQDQEVQEKEMEMEMKMDSCYESINTWFHHGSPQKAHQFYGDCACPAPLKRLQVEKDLDLSYSNNSFHASGVPFAWEEKPGTPKARSVTSEVSHGEDDEVSVPLSGSSDFEFSARFEDPPMSPTPISSSSANSFKHLHVQASYDGPISTYKLALAKDHLQSTGEQIWPLPLPPFLHNPVLPMKQLIKGDISEHNCSYRSSQSSFSVPQSPRSPRKFDIRGVLCGMWSPGDAVFDPFLVAMEKSMGKDRGNSSRVAPHHRRTQSSSSQWRIFHWDEHYAKSCSSSNGSSSMVDDIKSKHPIQREIDARHMSMGTPKGSKRWSFREFLVRMSGRESARHSNTSSNSIQSLGCESNSRGEHGSFSAIAEGDGHVELRNSGDDMSNFKRKSTSSPMSSNSSTMLSSLPFTILSPSASNKSSKGKHNAGPRSVNHKAPTSAPVQYDTAQRAHTDAEHRNKRSPLYKQGLLGCLRFPSKVSYRAIASLSKPLQSTS